MSEQNLQLCEPTAPSPTCTTHIGLIHRADQADTQHNCTLTYDSVAAACQTQRLNHRLDPLNLVLFRHVGWQAQHGSKVQSLVDSQGFI